MKRSWLVKLKWRLMNNGSSPGLPGLHQPPVRPTTRTRWLKHFLWVFSYLLKRHKLNSVLMPWQQWDVGGEGGFDIFFFPWGQRIDPNKDSRHVFNISCLQVSFETWSYVSPPMQLLGCLSGCPAPFFLHTKLITNINIWADTSMIRTRSFFSLASVLSANLEREGPLSHTAACH